MVRDLFPAAVGGVMGASPLYMESTIMTGEVLVLVVVAAFFVAVGAFVLWVAGEEFKH